MLFTFSIENDQNKKEKEQKSVLMIINENERTSKIDRGNKSRLKNTQQLRQNERNKT
jgi:hypothetical protein